MAHGVEGAWILAETDGHVFSALSTALILTSAHFNIAWTDLLIISHWKVSQPDFPRLVWPLGYTVYCTTHGACGVSWKRQLRACFSFTSISLFSTLAAPKALVPWILYYFQRFLI
jgi:hypothetical protein